MKVSKQSQQEVRFVVLSQEDIQQIAILAAKEGVAAYKKEQEIRLSEQTEKVRNSAKMLLRHYRKLKRMEDTSIYDIDTITDPTLSEIFEHILDECRRGEFHLSSIKKNRLITGIILNHVDVQLENYKKECSRSNIPDIQRRYRIVKRMYLDETPIKAEEVAEEENINKSNIYRTLERAYDDLTVLFFGVEGLDIAEYKKRRYTERQNRIQENRKMYAKKMH